MLGSKIIFLLVLILNITDGTNSLNCKEVMEIFYQTEDQFYELDCTESQKLESNVTLTYHCRSLQKKMDIFGRKYYDFGVSRNLRIDSKLIFFHCLGMVYLDNLQAKPTNPDQKKLHWKTRDPEAEMPILQNWGRY